jgi:hypothetical protein
MSCGSIYSEYRILGPEIHKFLRFDKQSLRHGIRDEANGSTSKSAAIDEWNWGSEDCTEGDDDSA